MKTAFNSIQQKRFLILLTLLIGCVILTIGLDLAESKFHNSSFYFFESFLFSSFWWLFIPLLYGQFFISNGRNTKSTIILRVLIPPIIHLLAYPSIVWLISGIFYYHTFSYVQTLQYGLTEYLFILCVVYTIPLILYTSFKRGLTKVDKDSPAPNHFAENFIVIDGKNRINISTKDILFISSNPPYVNIHHTNKRYIHKETLKSLLEKLDYKIFVQVHKSTIVNLTKVHSYKSRLNGDYDLQMNDGVEIRLSRNYVSNFRMHFPSTPQVKQ